MISILVLLLIFPFFHLAYLYFNERAMRRLNSRINILEAKLREREAQERADQIRMIVRGEDLKEF